MFDLILSHGGRLDIKNRQGLTPLTLAAKLARKEVRGTTITLYLCAFIMCFCVWVCVRVYVCLHTHAQLRWTFNKRMVGYKAYLLVFNVQPFKKVIADMQNYENANFHFISITDVWAHPGKREAGLLDLWKCDLRRLSPHPHWYHLAYRGDQHRLSVEYYCLWSRLLFQLSMFYVYLCVCVK